MDLNTIEALVRPDADQPSASWREGDAWLAGGTWLFSEPQPALRRLVDLSALPWPALTVDDDGLHLSATCTFATLAAFEPPSDWPAAALTRPCCEALLGSFKIWNMATVGGNLCLALPAGPIAALATALDATCRILTPAGDARRDPSPAGEGEAAPADRGGASERPGNPHPPGSKLRFDSALPSREGSAPAAQSRTFQRERFVPAASFILGTRKTILDPREILRSIDIPVAALARRTAFRRASLTPLGRSAALLIGTLAADGAFALTVTAATDHPMHLSFAAYPSAAELRDRLADAIPGELLVDDVHGDPAWRRHMTGELAESIRRELSDGAPR